MQRRNRAKKVKNSSNEPDLLVGLPGLTGWTTDEVSCNIVEGETDDALDRGLSAILACGSIAESHDQHQSHKMALNSGVRASEAETCVIMASDPLGALCR